MRSREGFTALEIMIATVLLFVVLVCLGALSYQAARQALNENLAAGRRAVALASVSELTALPLAQLVARRGTTCDTLRYAGQHRYRRCFEVRSEQHLVTVSVAVTPLAPGATTQTIRFERAAVPLPADSVGP